MGDRFLNQLDEGALGERVVLAEVDGASRAGIQAGVEQPGRIIQLSKATPITPS